MNNESLDYLEERFNKINEHCNKCHGNFNDDCRDCSYLDLREDLREQIKQLKNMTLNESGIMSAEDAHDLTKKIIDVDGMVAAYEERIPALTTDEVRKSILDIYREGITHTLEALKYIK